MKITIHYYNEIYMKIDTERSIEYELRDYFSFFANNYKFNPKFRHGTWDGKIRMYNGRDQTLYIGLLYDLYKFAKTNGYEICFNENDKSKFKPSIHYNEDWVTDFHINKGKFALKDYQLNAFIEAIKHNKSLILSPTGCHGFGQPILMHDGSIKQVQDIEVGDLLMGDDNLPRRVLKLHHGIGDMRTIVPLNYDIHLSVNLSHILSLYSLSTKKVIDISVALYEMLPEYLKNDLMLFKKSIDFGDEKPYIKSQVLWSLSNNRISDIIKLSSKDTRLSFIKYIIGEGLQFKSTTLFNDLNFVADSIGCKLKIDYQFKNNDYSYHIEFDDEHTNINDIQLIDFNITNQKPNHYFGFEVDGNHRYLLDNFIVTHNSGKSYLLYTVMRYLLDINHINKKNRLLINVPNIGLVNQLYSDFIDYVKDDFRVNDFVTRAGGNNTEDDTKPIVISTWQTSMRKDKSYFDTFNSYILDEAHQATAKEISRIIDSLDYCKFKMGLTGTLDGTDMHELEMRARFGKLYQAATTKQLMESGDLAKLNIDTRILRYSDDDIKEVSKLLRGKSAIDKYHTEIDFIINNKSRNEYIIDVAMNTKKNVLMLFNYVDKHGKILLDEMTNIQDKYYKRVYFIYGGVDGDEREAIRTVLDKNPPVWFDLYIDDFRFIRIRGEKFIKLSNDTQVSGFDLKLIKKYTLDKNWVKTVTENDIHYHNIKFDDNDTYEVKKIKRTEGSSILLASYGTLTVGINIKNLHTLILCHPVKKQIRLLQSIGRILRKANDKNEVTLIDIVDDFSKHTKKKTITNNLMKQFLARLKIYDSQEFDYDINKINL